MRLGLIGDNIRQSKSPALHILAGQLCGLPVSYELLVPADAGLDFDGLFEWCKAEGFRGVNITYPYKEKVFSRLAVNDARLRSIGACNTVLFEDDGPRGLNSDYTGFVAAFRASLPQTSPGTVAMAGAGGVGKAVAFGLAELGATRLRVFDRDRQRVHALAASLAPVSGAMTVEVCANIAEACEDSDGLVNCTPLGMDGIPGSAIPAEFMSGAQWAFDAVYTPVDTEFLQSARAHGLATISGYELFFCQGVDAFRAFTGTAPDEAALRGALVGEKLSGMPKRRFALEIG